MRAGGAANRLVGLLKRPYPLVDIALGLENEPLPLVHQAIGSKDVIGRLRGSVSADGGRRREKQRAEHDGEDARCAFCDHLDTETIPD